jgi:hypothetical protein
VEEGKKLPPVTVKENVEMQQQRRKEEMEHRRKDLRMQVEAQKDRATNSRCTQSENSA